MPLDTPTLSITDAGTGVAATATISGSTLGTTNTIKAQAVADRGNTTWVTLGSRSGDGTVALTLSASGYWWFQVESSSGGEQVLGNLVYARVHDDADAMQKQVWDGCLARLQEVTFDGIPTSSIHQQHEMKLDEIAKPCIVLTLEGGLSETEERVVNERDDLGLPIGVIFLDDVNAEEGGSRLLWRQQAMDALRNQHLTDMPESKTCIIEPAPILGEKGQLADLWWSGFVARFWIRKTRGLT